MSDAQQNSETLKDNELINKFLDEFEKTEPHIIEEKYKGFGDKEEKTRYRYSISKTIQDAMEQAFSKDDVARIAGLSEEAKQKGIEATLSCDPIDNSIFINRSYLHPETGRRESGASVEIYMNDEQIDRFEGLRIEKDSQAEKIIEEMSRDMEHKNSPTLEDSKSILASIKSDLNEAIKKLDEMENKISPGISEQAAQLREQRDLTKTAGERA